MADPRIGLETVIQTALDSALKELHTCLPAVITKVEGQLIDAQPTIQRKIKGVMVNLPLLEGVPLRYMKSAKFSISFPMEIGDHVLIIFAERSIDTWLMNGDIQAPGDLRKHSLSDAFALPFMYPETGIIDSFSSENLEIKTADGVGHITMLPSGVIQFNGSEDFLVAYTDLKTAFDQLVTDFNAHIHATTATVGSTPTVGTISAPTVPSTADMAGAKLETLKVP